MASMSYDAEGRVLHVPTCSSQVVHRVSLVHRHRRNSSYSPTIHITDGKVDSRATSVMCFEHAGLVTVSRRLSFHIMTTVLCKLVMSMSMHWWRVSHRPACCSLETSQHVLANEKSQGRGNSTRVDSLSPPEGKRHLPFTERHKTAPATPRQYFLPLSPPSTTTTPPPTHTHSQGYPSATTAPSLTPTHRLSFCTRAYRSRPTRQLFAPVCVSTTP